MAKKKAAAKKEVKPKPEGYVFGHPTDYASWDTIEKTRAYLDSCKDGYFPQLVEVRPAKKKGGKPEEIFKMVYKVHLPTIEGLAAHLRVSRDTIYEWEKVHPNFSDILADLRAKQGAALINNSLSGNYHSTIAKVLLTKHGYVEKVETDNKNKHSGNVSLSALYDATNDE